MTFSIIIPTLNEEACVSSLLKQLTDFTNTKEIEIILVDGGSTDQTVEIAKTFNIRVLCSKKRSRAHQMNLGAEQAKGNVLVFVHADVKLHDLYFEEIETTITAGNHAGCFSYQFDSNRTLLKLNAWFTRFDGQWCGGGDQTLFITSDLFRKFNGFDEKYVFMEDFELTSRLRKKKLFTLIDHPVTVSARKYEKNSYLRVQVANLIMVLLFRISTPPQFMAKMYRRLLH